MVAGSCCAVLIACGGGGARSTGDASAGESEGSSLTNASATSPMSEGSGSGEGSMSGASTNPSSTVADTSTNASADEGIIFDVGASSDVGVPPCGGKGKGGQPEFSYIWVCNSGEGTISKINTTTLVEEGRYQTRPDTLGSPSRTSVNLSGDVAVANRLGGVTKLYALGDHCVDSNGMAGIQTSTGKTDVLPWGVEECVAWHTPLPYSTNRPVAWAPGDFNPATCTYENQMLWTAGGQNDVIDSLEVVRLNGEDGSIDATIPMPDVPIGYFGAYGGAVNQDGDFWFVVYDTFNVPETDLVRVDAVTLDYEKFPVPAEICPYGFTVDSSGRPWIGSFCSQSARFTPGTNTWDLFAALGYGIQEDADGRMWLADYLLPGVREIDSDTLTLGAQIALPASSPKGVSIDFEGYVWVVDMGSSAFKVDPDTMTFEVYNQLNGPYTYSDMTGWGLSNVTFPPG
jgi:hypothetical protein